MAFFGKADAKVRTIFELPKLFRRNFQKKFFERWFVTLTSFQYFNSSAFLSRKRVQKYCFTAYVPNFLASFFRLKCTIFPKSLILKRCRTAGFHCAFLYIQTPIPFIYTRAYTSKPSGLPTLLQPTANPLVHSADRVAGLLTPCLRFSCHRQQTDM